MNDVISLPAVRFGLSSDDPSFVVQRRSASRFHLSGHVVLEPHARLDVTTPGANLDVALAPQSLPEQAVEVVRRRLPRGLSVSHHAASGGVELQFLEGVLPAARLPRLRLLVSEPGLRVSQLEDNKVELSGRCQGPSVLTILCDGRRASLRLSAGMSDRQVAARVGQSVPHGYRALVDGPQVSVWKDADFFEMVA